MPRLHHPTHVYDRDTGYLLTLAGAYAGFYLFSERDRGGHEVCVFARTRTRPNPSAFPHRPLTHVCRFRFERGRRIRWMSDGCEPQVFYPVRRKEAHRIRIRVPQDIATWIADEHGTPRAWIDILLQAFGGAERIPDIERALGAAPKTYDGRTMYSVAQHAGRYVTATKCKPHHPERTIGARNGFYRDTPMHLGTLEGLQFVRAHRYAKPWQPIPLQATLPTSILALPRPLRALHTPHDRAMVTLPLSLPAPIRVPLEYAIHRHTNDTIDRWLSYLVMWGHSSVHHAVPVRVAARLGALLIGRPWIALFRQANQTTGLLTPHSFITEDVPFDEALWRAILSPGPRDYVP